MCRLRIQNTLAVLLMLAGGVTTLKADNKAATGISFNFSTPGARSLAMGGAFIGLADDATAAYTNPAGLTNLMVGGPEVAVEFRNWSYTDVTIRDGHILGPPSNRGIDTHSGVEFGETTSSVNGLSFLSVGYILPRGFTVALYRHELAHFRSSSRSEGLFYFGFPPDHPICALDSSVCESIGRFPGFDAKVDLSIDNYGFSAARSFSAGSRGEVSLGLGLSYYHLDLFDGARRFGYRAYYDEGLDRLPGGFFGPIDFVGDRFDGRDVERGNDSSFGVTAGFLWKPNPGGRWSLGGVYRQGPKFKTLVQSYDRLGALLDSEGRTFRVPDTIGLGLAWSAGEGRTKATLDVDRVRYSQRFHDLVRPQDTGLRVSAGDFRLADADEIHLGLEHVFLAIGSNLVGTLRLGGWWEPAHEVDYVGLYEELKPLLGDKGQGKAHFSAGLGFVVREDFQIDAAADFSENVDTLSLSIVKFF